MRILSGVQPSGRLHLGNYFGAIRQYLSLQAKGHECYYFIANYHAMTSAADRELMQESTLHVAKAFLALGVDPEKSVFFAQSDVPEVTELCWILNCQCPVSLMEKATSYKDKIAKGLSANMGLFDYPVLQAADILIYDADLVPVGQDQKQHIEMSRDLAGKFNNAYGGEFLKLPDPMIVENVAIVPGIDGQKMSKSYDNTIEIFQTAKQTKKCCGKIVTDSTALEDPKDPTNCNVFALLKLLAEPDELKDIETKYRAGGYGYGHAKNRLAELINELFAEAREKYLDLDAHPDKVREILKEGAKKARKTASITLDRVRTAAGLF